VTYNLDTTADLWDLDAPDPAAESMVLDDGAEHFIYVAAISPDNHWLVTAGHGGNAYVWDLTTPRPAASPTVLRGHAGAITAVAISPDNHWLVTGSGGSFGVQGDNTARIWDLTAPDPAASPIVLRGHENGITALAITSDQHWLVTVSDDGTARVWNLHIDELIGLVCRMAGRNLYHTEWDQYFSGQPYQSICPLLPPGLDAPPNKPMPFALPLLLVIVVRLLDEERFLVENLSGYAGYREKVGYRLVPLIW
jgi:WD40 repeat protein